MDGQDVEVVAIPIEEVQPGMSLVVERDGHAVLFRVEKMDFEYEPETGTVWTLESEPVEGGHPWLVQGSPGTIVRRILHKS